MDELRRAAQGDAAQAVVLGSASHELRSPHPNPRVMLRPCRSGRHHPRMTMFKIGQAAEQLAGHGRHSAHDRALRLGRPSTRNHPVDVTTLAREVMVRLSEGTFRLEC